MIFSSYKFLFVFLPIVLLGYFILIKLKKQTISKVWLALASFYFYWQGSMSFFPFFVFSVLFNYLIGTSMKRIQGKNSVLFKRILLAVGLTENILLLGYFKYTDFLIKNVNMLTGMDYALKGIVLPIGISFFTFQLIAFLVDSYRGKTKDYNFLNYLLFITFFPQLIVGPIVHHGDIVPQFENPEQPKFKVENLMLAVFLFSIGCAKKLLLADPLTSFAEGYFNNINVYGMYHFWHSWLGAISYTVSYYFDLSGYADMAIGLGLLFNIKLPPNFNSPYKARNFADYWRRWHMTLSKFLSDYVFRSVYRKGAGSLNFYLAVMVTFFVSGFWHGAGWTFVVWGLINGFFVVCAHFMERKGWKFPWLAAHLLTLLGVVATRILFVSKSFSDAAAVYKTMINIKVFNGVSIQGIMSSFTTTVTTHSVDLLILLAGITVVYFPKNTTTISQEFKPSLRYAILAGILLAVSIFWMGGVSRFLYFQF